MVAPSFNLNVSLRARVCYVNRLISAGFDVDVFVSFKLLWKSNLLPFCKTPRSKYPCLGFVGITQGLARTREVLVDGSRWMGCLENFSEKGSKKPILGIF